MNQPLTWPSRVRETALLGSGLLGSGLRRFVLERADGGDYPAASAGAHVLLSLNGVSQNGLARRWKNAYSLVSPPEQTRHLEIIVRRVSASRGGSAYMHDQMRPGDAVDVTGPANLFPIYRPAHRHLLLSAGIGLTPFLSYVPALRREGAAFALHHVCRAGDEAAFAQLLAPYASSDITIHTARDALDLPRLLRDEGLGTHLYVCGPENFMRGVVDAARQAGWPLAKLHREIFGAPPGGAPFLAILDRSRRRIPVAADETLLSALEAAGIDAPSLCRGGACGQCRVGVLDGLPDHRDHVLDAAERAGGRSIMTCVSRALGDTLVLDL